MGKTCSQDLSERVIAPVDGRAGVTSTAPDFRAGVSSIYKALTPTTHEIAGRPSGGARQREPAAHDDPPCARIAAEPEIAALVINEPSFRLPSWSTRRRLTFVSAAIGLVVLLVLGVSEATSAQWDAFHYNHLLGRGINFGGALEPPHRDLPGAAQTSNYFQTIKEAGFNSVRIPIRWSDHAETEPPYMINRGFLLRIDWAIKQALSRKLAVVIDVHDYAQIAQDPAKGLPRLVALWRQIAVHYRNWSDHLFFELLNEPHDQLTDERWQEIMPHLLNAVRESNPSRIVIIGPAHWNNLESLPNLQLPEKDRRLIITFHYYSPMNFTHQGASWVRGSDQWTGTKWTDTPEEHQALRQDFDKVAAWAQQHNRPVFLGEFGSIEVADMNSRAAWTRAVACEAGRHSISWAYWELAGSFAAYGQARMAWHEPLLRALMERGCNGR